MTTTTQQAIARQRDTQPTVGQFIARLTPEIARALPKHMDADRIARLALTVVRKDQALAKCKPESFAGAILTAAALGLEPGVDGEAYLVAYKGECTLIVGFKGYAKLFFQHPLALHLDAQTVHEHDDFDYAYGLDPFLTHKPARGERGKVVAYYAVAKLTTGAKAFVVLSPEEAKALRGGKVGASGSIPDPMHWMEKKTALRQLFKLLPKSATLARAIDADEQAGSDLRAQQLIEHTPVALPAGEPAADHATGEVLTGELDEPSEPDWPEVAQPGGSS